MGGIFRGLGQGGPSQTFQYIMSYMAEQESGSVSTLMAGGGLDLPRLTGHGEPPTKGEEGQKSLLFFPFSFLKSTNHFSP